MSMVAVAVGAGVAMTATGMIIDANARANAAEQEAAIKRLQAQEVERRAGLREADLRRFGDKFSSTQRANATSMSTSTLLLMEETQAELEREIYEANRQAAWSADMLRRGADVDMDSASAARTAGWFSAGGALAGGAGKIMTLSDPPGSPTALPKG